jgi:hypothetical protein
VPLAFVVAAEGRSAVAIAILRDLEDGTGEIREELEEHALLLGGQPISWQLSKTPLDLDAVVKHPGSCAFFVPP